MQWVYQNRWPLIIILPYLRFSFYINKLVIGKTTAQIFPWLRKICFKRAFGIEMPSNIETFIDDFLFNIWIILSTYSPEHLLTLLVLRNGFNTNVRSSFYIWSFGNLQHFKYNKNKCENLITMIFKVKS